VSVDALMESFVKWHGEVPPEAIRIDDAEAREYAVSWIRRNIGIGIAHSYAVGFEVGDRWWTLFFERSDHYRPHPEGSQRWHVEAYDHNGKSWIGNYYFWPANNRWRHVFHESYGEDYGRADSLGFSPDPNGVPRGLEVKSPRSDPPLIYPSSRSQPD
jgi:hypothetical protein